MPVPAAAAATAASGDGMMFESRLVWEDEQYSLEERRAMLPKYAAARARAAAAAGSGAAAGVLMGAGNGADMIIGGPMHMPMGQRPVMQ
jgi:hypothetical protein